MKINLKKIENTILEGLKELSKINIKILKITIKIIDINEENFDVIDQKEISFEINYNNNTNLVNINYGYWLEIQELKLIIQIRLIVVNEQIELITHTFLLIRKKLIKKLKKDINISSRVVLSAIV